MTDKYDSRLKQLRGVAKSPETPAAFCQVTDPNQKSTPPPLAYGPKQLARAANMSLSLLYKAWREGWGPKYGHAGARRIITHPHAVEWLQSLTIEDKRDDAA